MHNGRHIKEETVYGCKGKLYLLKCKDSLQIIWGITEQVSFQKSSEIWQASKEMALSMLWNTTLGTQELSKSVIFITANERSTNFILWLAGKSL